MAHLHRDPVVVDERDGSSTAMVAILLIVGAVFLVWLFAFSGVVFDRDGESRTPDRIEQNIDNSGETSGDTGGTTTQEDTGGTTTQESDAPAPEPS